MLWWGQTVQKLLPAGNKLQKVLSAVLSMHCTYLCRISSKIAVTIHFCDGWEVER